MKEEYIGYRKLWAAVIINAFYDLKGIIVYERKRAFNWLMSDDTAPTSFLWTCSMLDIHDVEALRQLAFSREGIRKMIKAAGNYTGKNQYSKREDE